MDNFLAPGREREGYHVFTSKRAGVSHFGLNTINILKLLKIFLLTLFNPFTLSDNLKNDLKLYQPLTSLN